MSERGSRGLHLFPVNQGDRRDGNTLFAPFETEPLSRGRFDGNRVGVDSDRAGDRFAHPVDMGAQFGPLHRDRAIYVAHSVTFLPEQFHTACQQELGVGSFEFVRGVGKVQADVTQGRSTQQGVADRVQYHIPVRMGDAAFRMLDFYPAEDQGQPFARGRVRRSRSRF